MTSIRDERAQVIETEITDEGLRKAHEKEQPINDECMYPAQYSTAIMVAFRRAKKASVAQNETSRRTVRAQRNTPYDRDVNASSKIHRPKLLDLFSGAGGAAVGYHTAGFDVTGVDINPQKNYPFRFVQTDALNINFIDGYDVIHASPPCQNYCWSTAKHRAKGNVYPDLIGATRDLLIASGKPYVIENVPTAPLRNPTYLEGTMFGLNVIRRRCFETNWWLPQPMYIKHRVPIKQLSKIGPTRILQKSAYCQVTTSGSDGWSCRLADWRVAMGIDWMTRSEIKEAIPPAYTEYIGRYLMGMLHR